MHRIIDIGIDTFQGSSFIETANSSADLSGLTGDNGYLYFEAKQTEWSALTTLTLKFSAVSTWDASSGYYETTVSSMHIYPVNSIEWYGFRVPISIDSQTGPSFDISSSQLFGIDLTFPTSNHTFSARNLIIEYGSEVNSLMQFSLVSSGGGDAVGLEPTWEYLSDERKIEESHRLKNGDYYVYKTGSFKTITLDIDYFPTSSAMVVNSLWLNNSPCYYYEVNSYTAIRTNVMVENNKKPFSKFQEPYTDLMTGKIELASI